MDAAGKPHFDFSQIGTADMRNLCATFLEAVQRFYENPANRERFEQWQKARETSLNT